MATYSVTTTAKQDAVLSWAAQRRGVTVQALMDGALLKVLKAFVAEKDEVDAAQVGQAYVAATNQQQSQVRTVLGL